MATEAHDRHRTRLFFTSAAADDETFQVIRFTGEEAISKPYHFEIDLVSDNPDIDMDSMIGMPARLTIEKDGDRRHIHGLLKTFELGDEAKTGRYYYRAEMVPRLWLMTLSRQNQIYQNKSVPEIIREELLATQNKGASAGISSKDFELRLTQQYVRREYIVQYAESDFNFISRLMEHEGLFYFFEQEGDREKLVITDNNIHLKPLAGEPRLAYRPAAGMSSGGESAVKDFACRRRRIPGHLVLKDYNYRLPHLPLQADATVDPASHGLVCSYGEHFKIPEEGQALAKVRSQEIRARQTIFQGRSDCIYFQAADKFHLEDHFRSTFNREYILTAVRHEGSQMLSGIADQAADKSPETDYGNSFEAVSADVAYRPARVTPKPKLYGIMNAHVDSALLEDRAEIDDQGRYKVVMPFDLSGPAGGKATRFIRMAQPYGGHDQGMHFPLRKNTEVIWTCIDGDPDRPIIIGTVPNPLTPSVVNSDNHTRNIIKTAHGSFIEFNDGRGNGTAPMTAPATPGGKLQPQQNHQSLHTDAYRQKAEPGSPFHSGSELYYLGPQSESSAPEPGKNTGQLTRQQQLQPNDVTYTESNPGSGNDIWFRVNVPEYHVITDEQDNIVTKYQSYMRLGKKADAETSLAEYEKNFDQDENNNEHVPPIEGPDGWLDYTDGNHTSIAQGHRKVLTGGNKSEIVNGTYNLTIAEGGMKVYDAQPFYNVSWHKSFGDSWCKFETQFLSEVVFTSGQSTNIFMGTKADATLGATLNIDLGLGINLGAMMQYENVVGPVINVSKESETVAEKSILLKVDQGVDQKQEKIQALTLLGGTAATAVASQAIAGGLSSWDWFKKKDFATWGGMLASGLIPAAAAAAAVFAYYKLSKRRKKPAPNTTQIEMSTDKIEINNKPAEGSENETIELKCGKSSIVLQANGEITIKGDTIVIDAKKDLTGLGNNISLMGDEAGKTTISGKTVTVHSDQKTTIGSTAQTAIEANAGVDMGGPDTKSAEIRQKQTAAKKKRKDRSSRIAESKAKRPPGKA